MHIVSTYLPPTAASLAIKCNLGDEFLVVAEINRLDLYKLADTGIQLVNSLELLPRIVALQQISLDVRRRLELSSIFSSLLYRTVQRLYWPSLTTQIALRWFSNTLPNNVISSLPARRSWSSRMVDPPRDASLAPFHRMASMLQYPSTRARWPSSHLCAKAQHMSSGKRILRESSTRHIP